MKLRCSLMVKSDSWYLRLMSCMVIFAMAVVGVKPGIAGVGPNKFTDCISGPSMLSSCSNFTASQTVLLASVKVIGSTPPKVTYQVEK